MLLLYSTVPWSVMKLILEANVALTIAAALLWDAASLCVRVLKCSCSVFKV